MQPPRVLYEIRHALDRNDILVSDVGLHKLWIGRMFPAYEPNTVLIANGLAGMGFAVPAAIAAKLVHPQRKVVAVNGDGGFLMNCQELETAARLKTPFVSVVWENRQFGSTPEAGQEVRRAFAPTSPPDFVMLAESFGIRLALHSPDEFPERLEEAPACTPPRSSAPTLLARRAISEELVQIRWPMLVATKSKGLDSVNKQLFIAASGEMAPRGALSIEDPATGEDLCEVADGTPDDARLHSTHPWTRGIRRDAATTRGSSGTFEILTSAPTSGRSCPRDGKRCRVEVGDRLAAEFFRGLREALRVEAITRPRERAAACWG